MTKISPIIVPTNPPTYEKYESTLLKFLLYFIFFDDFLKIISTFGCVLDLRKEELVNASGMRLRS